MLAGGEDPVLGLGVTTLILHAAGKDSACSFELDGLVEQGIWEKGVGGKMPTHFAHC